MKAKSSKAAKASSKRIHMVGGYPQANSPVPHGGTRRQLITMAAAMIMAGCGTRSARPPAPIEEARRTGPAASSEPRREARPASSALADSGAPRIERPASTWVRARWEDLPGLQDDAVGEALAALQAGCTRSDPAWLQACRAASGLNARDHAGLRRWMTDHLQPWRVEDRSGRDEGLLTGYYEPHFEARRQADREFRAPLHAPPADLHQRRPYWTRQQLETVREAQAALRGRAIAYLQDPLDVLVLQIQGSGRLTVTEPDGQRRTVRLAFAAHNDHPYQSVGRWLIEKGHLSASQASWPGIREWLQRNPRRVQEVLWVNPRVVFFREEPLLDPSMGPRGALGVPLTPQRSIAVDPRSIPYGSAVWMESTDPLGAAPLRRLVMAQDTGSAITGAVRADYFWGWGERAEQQAGRTRQRLRMWVLWPAGTRPPG